MNNGTHNYAYDQLYRLIQATHPQPANPMEQFNYDPVGNRLDNSIHDVGNRLLEDLDYYYDYDRNGNTTQKLSKTTGELTKFYYDAENQLTQLEKYHTISDTVPYSTVSYIYDGLGRRVAKNIDGAITKYMYDQEDILLETDVSDSIIARYTHGPGIDEPISMDRGGSGYYYIADALGSITKVVDALGNVINRYVYNSFGSIMEKTEGIANPYTYTDREYDPESGLYYYRARYYDARIGRFLSEDPIGFAGGINFYVYTGNDPINWKDSYGLLTIPFTDIWIPAGEEYGEWAAKYWAQKQAETGNWAYGMPGTLASLWIPESSDVTVRTLFTAYVIRVLGPFSQKGVPRIFQRLRKYIRFDPPHHRKGWHLDGDLFRLMIPFVSLANQQPVDQQPCGEE